MAPAGQSGRTLTEAVMDKARMREYSQEVVIAALRGNEDWDAPSRYLSKLRIRALIFLNTPFK
jgi:hypothetical protein